MDVIYQSPLRLKHQESANLLIPFLWKSQKTKMHPKVPRRYILSFKGGRRSPLSVCPENIPSKLYNVVASSAIELKHNHDHSNDIREPFYFQHGNLNHPGIKEVTAGLLLFSKPASGSHFVGISKVFLRLPCLPPNLVPLLPHDVISSLVFSSHGGPIAAPQQLWACSL